MNTPETPLTAEQKKAFDQWNEVEDLEADIKNIITEMVTSASIGMQEAFAAGWEAGQAAAKA